MNEQHSPSASIAPSLLPDTDAAAGADAVAGTDAAAGTVAAPASAPEAPKERLSPAFNRLWVAAIASNMSDGIGRVAIPLIAASITRDPAAMGVLGALGVVPWLAFGVLSGVLVDRFDRRKAMAVANALRLAAAGGLAALVLTDHATLPWLAAAVLVFGAGETLFDNATNAVIPSVVSTTLRDKANSRIQAAQVAVDLFVATPLGSAMFALAAVLPIAVGGGGYAIAAVLALALPAVAGRALRERPDASAASDAQRPAAREGIAYLWQHKYLRSMTLMTSVEAALLTFAQATSILLFLDRYDVPAAALGAVTASVGLGGLAGSLIAPALVARWGRSRVMLGATIMGGVGLLAVALSPSLWLAMVSYGLGAAGVSAWNVPWASVRQALIPDRLMGRVIGFARTIAWGLIPVATLAGGFVGRINLQLSFAIGGAGSVLLALACSRLILSTERVVAQQGVHRGDETADE